jgi:hypothetical protein
MDSSLTEVSESLFSVKETSNLIISSSREDSELTKSADLIQAEIVEEKPQELSEDAITSSKLLQSKQGLKNLNEYLAKVAEKLVAQNQIDGLFLTGLTLKPTTAILSAFSQDEKQSLDKQAMGTQIIARFQQIVPQAFTNEEPSSFKWTDSTSKKQYRFYLEGGESDRETGEKSPLKLIGVELSKEGKEKQQVFQASSNNARQWKIEQCDFTESQLKSLARAENPKRIETEKSPLVPKLQMKAELEH